MVRNQTYQSELVIGSCYPFGADQNIFRDVLEEYLNQVGYRIVEIRLSDIVKEFELEPTSVTDEFTAVPMENPGEGFLNAWELMQRGTLIRKAWCRGDALALLAVSAIAASRDSGAKPTCYYIRSLKHDEEINTLRKVYGDGFYSVGLHADFGERKSYLIEERGMCEREAGLLITTDQGESERLGQQTRKTFELCDFFIRVGDRPSTREQLHRFLDLVFGNPYQTPTPQEYGMFLAFTASLRSADLSRQVGASIFSKSGELVSLGCNDVPRSGGGLYWPNDKLDAREFKRGYDSNEKETQHIIISLMQAIANPLGLEQATDEELLVKGLELFKGTRLEGLTEFGRIVHAEMDALLCAARTGVSVEMGTLYTTTFPCHNCAKHIIAAGIREIFYVEPYPKSLALKLHWDALELDSLLSPPEGTVEVTSSQRVRLSPFIGVAARRFTDIFSIGWSSGRKLKRKNDEGNVVEWKRSGKSPRTPMLPLSYIEREVHSNAELEDLKNGKSQNQTQGGI